MPAYKYSAEDDSVRGTVTVETGFDAGQFGDVELIGTLMEFKEAKKEFWSRIGYGGSIPAYPIFHEGFLYFGACDGIFYALDKDGKEKWRFATKGPITIPSGAWKKLVFACSTDGSLYALDYRNGELVWKFETRHPIWGVKATEDRMFMGCGDGNMYCLDPETGKMIWRFPTNDAVTPPTIKDDHLYFGYEGKSFYCLDMDGKLVWRYDVTGTVSAWFNTAVVGDNIYFGCYDKNLYCVEAASGRLKWKFMANDAVYEPKAWGNKIYFGARDFNIYCVNADNGTLLWKFQTNGFTCGVTVSEGRVYAGSHDNNVYCIDAGTGKEIWKYKTRGLVNFAAVDNGKVYFGSWDCNLYCADASTGKLEWKFPTSISSPSPIEPPETSLKKTAEVTWKPESEEEKKKYVGEGGGGDYDLNLSQYGVMDKGYVGGKKKGYIK